MKITLVDKVTKEEITTFNVIDVSHPVHCTETIIVTEDDGLGWSFSIEDYGFIIEP